MKDLSKTSFRVWLLSIWDIEQPVYIDKAGKWGDNELNAQLFLESLEIFDIIYIEYQGKRMVGKNGNW